MAFPYDTPNSNYFPPVSFSSSEPDELSFFLQQFLMATNTPVRNAPPEHLAPYYGRISVPDPPPGLNSSCFPAIVSSPPVGIGTFENVDTDEYDGESEVIRYGLYITYVETELWN